MTEPGRNVICRQELFRCWLLALLSRRRLEFHHHKGLLSLCHMHIIGSFEMQQGTSQ